MTDRKQQLLAMLAKSPNDLFLRFALAMEHAKLGETREAVAAFDSVLAADPGYVTAWFQKANLLEQFKQFDLAKETYRKGVQAAAIKGDHHSATKMREALERLVRATE
jgi:Tfp pilus assembly protein PilF